MTGGSWYAQPFRADGGITAEGLLNQLGRPSLSLLTVLVRESAQNSWDARVGPEVRFDMDLRSVGPGAIGDWRTLLGTGMPTVGPDQFPLRRLLNRPAFRCLAVSDRGTAGLGGPTRSDHTAAPGQRNWLSFVLNSGEVRDVDGGGGTYGYGKGVFFLASRVRTVLIYTRFLDGDLLRTRLIGSVLGHSFPLHGRPYTGRHWWGRPHEDHCEPLEDGEADLVARRLGLRPFLGDETGTTVVIVDPDLLDPTMPDGESDQLDPRDAGQVLADAMAWNLWPLMAAGRTPRMTPGVTVDGSPVPVPDASSDAVIAHFTAAYQDLRSGGGEDVECRRPRRRLGRFAFERTFGAVTESHAARDLGIEGAPHHVCLMRSPDLVVRYLEGPPGPHPSVGYAGVMRAENDLDDIFAKAEPPTHDAWIETQLQGVEATFVRVTHRRLRERATEISGRRRSDVAVADVQVGHISRRLGHLLAGAGLGADNAGTPDPGARSGAVGGAGPVGRGSGGEPGGSRAMANRGHGRPRLDGSPRYVDTPGGTVIEQHVRLPGRGRFRAEARVLTGDGLAESDPFVGAAMPRILAWRVGELVVAGETLDAEEPGDAVVIVQPIPDAALEISVGGPT